MDELTHLRAEIDQFMQLHPQSPLPREKRAEFNGLDYYESNNDLSFISSVDLLPRSEGPIMMETSTGDTREYFRWGKVTFDVEGEEVSVIIYSDGYGEELFLPFKDASNGKETYGAGRYLDNHRPGLRRIGADQIELDFNFAYNPYCAYQSNYSCPLPPRENWLTVPIRAGEKKFDK